MLLGSLTIARFSLGGLGMRGGGPGAGRGCGRWAVVEGWR